MEKRKAGTNSTCPFNRGVRKRELTVNLFHLFSTFSSLISGLTVLNINLLYGLQSTLSSRTTMSFDHLTFSC